MNSKNINWYTCFILFFWILSFWVIFNSFNQFYTEFKVQQRISWRRGGRKKNISNVWILEYTFRSFRTFFHANGRMAREHYCDENFKMKQFRISSLSSFSKTRRYVKLSFVDDYFFERKSKYLQCDNILFTKKNLFHWFCTHKIKWTISSDRIFVHFVFTMKLFLNFYKSVVKLYTIWTTTIWWYNILRRYVLLLEKYF